MMTYNHAPYLEQAVMSVMQQQCRVSFELLIGDDCSIDETLKVANRLQSRFPAMIRILPSLHNLGITPNFQRLVAASHGKYIAMLEGDDYWIDATKLQDQYDLMESDESLALCAGRTQNRLFWAKVRPRYSLADLLRCYLFHTSTLFFRKVDVPDLKGFEDIHALDSVLIAFLAEKGDCGFIDRELSYYRRHRGGAWSGQKRRQQIVATQQVSDALLVHFDNRHMQELGERELWIYGMMARINTAEGLLSQWVVNLKLIPVILSRTFTLLPRQSTRLLISLLAQPLISGIQMMRFRLGLGSRLRSLFQEKTTRE